MPRPDVFTSAIETSSDAILVWIADQQLFEEVSLIVAATGRPMLTVGSTAGSEVFSGAKWRQSAAVIVDNSVAARIQKAMESGTQISARGPLIVVSGGVSDSADQVVRAVGAALEVVLPAENIRLVSVLGRSGQVNIPGSSPGERNLMMPPVAPRTAPLTAGIADIAGAAPSIAVIPAVGGAGASVMAACLAINLAQYRSCCLIDADEYSGGADLLMGMESEPGVRWGDLGTGTGQLDPEALMTALPVVRTRPELRVLTSTRCRGVTSASTYPSNYPTPEGVAKVMSTLLSHEVSVVVDLPRDRRFFPMVLEQVDIVAIAVPQAVRAIAAAGKLATEIRDCGIEPVALLRAQRSNDISAQEIAQATDIRIAGEVKYLRGLSHEIDVSGLGRSVGVIGAGLAPLIERLVGSLVGRTRHG